MQFRYFGIMRRASRKTGRENLSAQAESCELRTLLCAPVVSGDTVDSLEPPVDGNVDSFAEVAETDLIDVALIDSEVFEIMSVEPGVYEEVFISDTSDELWMPGPEEAMTFVVDDSIPPGDGDGPVDWPSDGPTDGPTDGPVDWPTDGPTDGPVDWPTEGPTDGPVDGPTDGPVDGPTEGPTDGPVDWPTEGPTDGPVDWPTEGPTDGPVDGPTEGPTDGPVDGPTDAPVEDYYYGGSYDEYYGGSYDEYYGGSYDEYYGGSYDEYYGGSYDEYYGGSYDEYYGGSYDEYYGGSYDEYYGGNYDEYYGGSYDEYYGGSYDEYYSGGSYDEYYYGDSYVDPVEAEVAAEADVPASDAFDPLPLEDIQGEPVEVIYFGELYAEQVEGEVADEVDIPASDPLEPLPLEDFQGEPAEVIYFGDLYSEPVDGEVAVDIDKPASDPIDEVDYLFDQVAVEDASVEPIDVVEDGELAPIRSREFSDFDPAVIFYSAAAGGVEVQRTNDNGEVHEETGVASTVPIPVRPNASNSLFNAESDRSLVGIPVGLQTTSALGSNASPAKRNTTQRRSSTQVAATRPSVASEGLDSLKPLRGGETGPVENDSRESSVGPQEVESGSVEETVSDSGNASSGASGFAANQNVPARNARTAMIDRVMAQYAEHSFNG